MKRDNIQLLIAFLDALRRDDRAALDALVAHDAVWQGLRSEWACRSGAEVIQMFASRRDDLGEITAIELLGGEDAAVLHASGGDLVAVEDLPLSDGIYNVFTIEDGKVTRIDDFAERGPALEAAGTGA
jgi:ketosteroid isomerase-like protein